MLSRAHGGNISAMNQNPSVMIVHGFLMRSPCLWPLGAMLARRGFSVRYFDFPSTRWSISCAAETLHAELDRHGITNLVAHSLGGIVSCEAVLRSPGSTGRLVLLGSPVQGSTVAKILGRWPVIHRLFGPASAAWSPHSPRTAPAGWEVGTIIGRRQLGAGTLLLRGKGQHDGVVLESETALPGERQRVAVQRSHSGMIFSPQVAGLTASFLKQGSFNDPLS
jgi:pimeloyl-ACP methyl ester carboxylesterase